MLKLILCIAVILCSGGLGLIKAQEFSGRLTDLQDIKNMVKILETEMSYKKDPLPNAFARISTYKDNRAMDFLWECSQAMKDNLNFSSCWERGLDSIYGSSYLTQEDLLVLRDMGLQLGKSDIQGQASMFSLANIKLDEQIEHATHEKKTKGKMYKGLGFSIGTVIAIILF